LVLGKYGRPELESGQQEKTCTLAEVSTRLES
jgi:hypothetical protein